MVAGDVGARPAKPPRRDNPDGSMTLLEHLKEFQVRLFRAVIAIAIGSAIAYVFYDPIFHAIRRPFDDVVNQARADGKTVELVISGVTDAFTLKLQIVVVVGLILSAPFWLYQLWRFLAPGLNSNERKWAYGFAFTATPLFVFGCAVAYLAMPNLLAIMLGFTPENVANLINVNEYLGFILQIMLFFGICALIPLIFVMLNFSGIIDGRTLLRHWRWLVIGVLTFAAVATPTPDPFTMMLVALPFMVIVAVAIAIMLVNDARRARRSAREGFTDLSDDEASPLPEQITDPDDLRPSRIDEPGDVDPGGWHDDVT
jgi:sec-independent protein translocase protein TatC